MSLGITNINNTNLEAIDLGAIKDVTEQILTRGEQKTFSIDTADLSKFQKVELGKDLYNGTLNIDAARQIAVRNSGLDINLNQGFVANIQYLNSKASQLVHTTDKNVEGKIYVPAAVNEAEQTREVFQLPKSTTLEDTKSLNRDRQGSNPFFQSQLGQGHDQNQHTKEDSLSIFS